MKLRARPEVLSSPTAWKIKERADCTLVVGRDFAWHWLLYTTMGMARFGLALLEWRWGLSASIVVAVASIALVATLALGRAPLRHSGERFRAVTLTHAPLTRLSAACRRNDHRNLLATANDLNVFSVLYFVDDFGELASRKRGARQDDIAGDFICKPGHAT